MTSLLGRNGVRMAANEAGKLHTEGVAALARMEEALELLDRCDGATEVGAQLDLAICRLRNLIGRNPLRTSVGSPAPRLEP